MGLLELTQAIELDTPFGRGRALFIETGGPDADLLWFVALPSGAVICARNRDVRLAPNWTHGVRRDEAEERILDATGAAIDAPGDVRAIRHAGRR